MYEFFYNYFKQPLGRGLVGASAQQLFPLIPLPIQYNAYAWFDAGNPKANKTSYPNNTALSPWISAATGGLSVTAGNSTPSKQPIYVANDQGSPSVTASASAQQYCATTVNITLTSTTTIMAVANPSTTASAYLCSGFSTGAAPAFLYGFTANTFEWYNTPDRQTLGVATSGYHILTITQTDGANCTGYFDRTQAFTFTPTVALNGRAINEFFSSTGAANFYTGGIKDFLIFRSILSSTQLNNMFNYLKNKNGLAI